MKTKDMMPTLAAAMITGLMPTPVRTRVYVKPSRDRATKLRRIKNKQAKKARRKNRR